VRVAGGVVEMSVGKARLLEATREFGGDSLRDLHVFTEGNYEAIYLRDDIEAHLEDIDVPKYIDNERYGYITRATYEDLHYTEYRYTVRGFEGFEQFRTFLGPDHDIGVMASFDQGGAHDSWLTLQERLEAVLETVGIDALRPAETD
jgi:hypothetical protein